jgi:hypothetical protein
VVRPGKRDEGRDGHGRGMERSEFPSHPGIGHFAPSRVRSGRRGGFPGPLRGGGRGECRPGGHRGGMAIWFRYFYEHFPSNQLRHGRFSEAIH